MKRFIDFKSRFRILKGGKISLVVSAMLASTIANTIVADDIIVDGNSNTGVFIGTQFFDTTKGSLTYSGSSDDNVVVGTSNDKTTFTNFFTEGGAGSGGGAGLGGVFFVDQGAQLTLNNVSFSSNLKLCI